MTLNHFATKVRVIHKEENKPLCENKKAFWTLRRIQLSVRMPCPLARPQIQLIDWSFTLAHRLHEQAAVILASLRGYACSPDIKKTRLFKYIDTFTTKRY